MIVNDRKRLIGEAFEKSIVGMRNNKGSHVHAAALRLLDHYAEKLKEEALSSDSPDKDLYAARKIRELVNKIEKDPNAKADKQTA